MGKYVMQDLVMIHWWMDRAIWSTSAMGRGMANCSWFMVWAVVWIARLRPAGDFRWVRFQDWVGNHLVTASGDAATVTASFIATHQYADKTWTLGGDYEFRLLDDAEWRITAMTMTPVWHTGPADLIQHATGN